MDVNFNIIFSAIDFIVRLVIVLILFLIASILRRTDADVIRSRLYLGYDKITKSFVLLFLGSLFFFIAAVIEYIIDPVKKDNMFLIMKLSLTIFQIIVIYFIITLKIAVSPAGKRGM
jgi:hypothetical protein